MPGRVWGCWCLRYRVGWVGSAGTGGSVWKPFVWYCRRGNCTRKHCAALGLGSRSPHSHKWYRALADWTLAVPGTVLRAFLIYLTNLEGCAEGRVGAAWLASARPGPRPRARTPAMHLTGPGPPFWWAPVRFSSSLYFKMLLVLYLND